MFFIIFENTNYADAIADPNFAAFAKEGVAFSNWMAVGHPSQPNYIAITSGDTQGITGDSSTNVNAKNVADLLEAKGLTWKSYQENWPGNCFTGTVSSDSLYYRKHNPFISYEDIQSNPARCANIVDSTELAKDLSSGNLPTFAWYTPNINNDGHNTNVGTAGSWFSGFLKSSNILSHYDVVLATFDESETYTGPNQVYAAIAGKAVTAKGVTDNTALTHYSVLATLEQALGLGSLGKNDASAPVFKIPSGSTTSTSATPTRTSTVTTHTSTHTSTKIPTGTTTKTVSKTKTTKPPTGTPYHSGKAGVHGRSYSFACPEGSQKVEAFGMVHCQ